MESQIRAACTDFGAQIRNGIADFGGRQLASITTVIHVAVKRKGH